MSDLTTLSIEANDECSLVYLIDENLCLSNSYEVINTNSQELSGALIDLSVYANSWDDLYTDFTENSAKWLNAISNITTLSAQWESAYATKVSYKKYWENSIYVVYPTFVEFATYYSNVADLETTVKNWLEVNYPCSEHFINQKIDVSVNLYTVDSFDYNFSRAYYETCTPATGNSSATICCNGCGRGDAGQCNHYGEPKHGHKVAHCSPVCDSCGVTTDHQCASYTCQTYSGPAYLYLSYDCSFSDRFINRIISLVYQNNSSNWIKI